MKNSLSDILETISNPDLIQRGDAGTLLGIKKYPKTPVSKQKFLIVVYKEVDLSEGFVLTAYYSNKLRKRVILWEKH